MEADFHPARLRGLWATLLDIVFAAAVVGTLLLAVLTMLSDNARDELARAYARQFVLHSENDCPTGFGNAFWFACAGEVRRIAQLHQGPTATPSPAPQPMTSAAQAATRPPPSRKP